MSDPGGGGAFSEDTARPASFSKRRLLSLLEVLICSGFPTQMLVTLPLVALGLTDGGLSLAYVVWLSLGDTLLVVALVVLFIRVRGEAVGDVLLGTRRPRRESVIGLLLLPVCFLLVAGAALLIEHLAPWLRDPAGNPLAALLRSPLDAAIFAVVAVVAGGLREEMQRAFILHRFEQHLGGAALGLILFSVAFGLGHAVQGWDAAVLTGLLGLFWGGVYLWRRSIVAVGVCHALFNLVEVVSHGLQA